MAARGKCWPWPGRVWEFFFVGLVLGLIGGVVMGAKAMKKSNKVSKCDICLRVPEGKKVSVTKNNEIETCLAVE